MQEKNLGLGNVINAGKLSITDRWGSYSDVAVNVMLVT